MASGILNYQFVSPRDPTTPTAISTTFRQPHRMAPPQTFTVTVETDEPEEPTRPTEHYAWRETGAVAVPSEPGDGRS